MKSFEELARTAPTGPVVQPADVAAQVRSSGRLFVVLDDDPTGTQSVADLPVLTHWDVEDFTWAFGQRAPAVYVMTNSRSLDPEHAEQVNREVAAAALQASQQSGVPLVFVSRSDSTLRGHFPLEPDVLSDVLAAVGRPVDGVILVPAFADAGRLTVDGIHYAGSRADGFIPVGESEFAKDATFGYRSSDLRDWVVEKTGGGVSADSVVLIDLATLRSGPAAVAEILRDVSAGTVVAADCLEENDLLLLAAALERAEAGGRHFVYRVGPPFMRARIGQVPHAPLTRADVDRIADAGHGEHSVGGLIVVGSHVAQTTRQLDTLRARRTATELEIDVAAVLDPSRREAHLQQVVRSAVDGLARGNVVVSTTRRLVTGDDAGSSLGIARDVSRAVVDVVQGILKRCPPRFVVAKGGITSSDVATHGLSIRRAFVRGPMLPGIVSLWEPSDGPALGIPYVVFAGNVGDDQGLADVVDKLSA
ncbi:MAG: four-carbon acid sugar kinase family protein [Dermatophilaceae bacterium]